MQIQLDRFYSLDVMTQTKIQSENQQRAITQNKRAIMAWIAHLSQFQHKTNFGVNQAKTVMTN